VFAWGDDTLGLAVSTFFPDPFKSLLFCGFHGAVLERCLSCFSPAEVSGRLLWLARRFTTDPTTSLPLQSFILPVSLRPNLRPVLAGFGGGPVGGPGWLLASKFSAAKDIPCTCSFVLKQGLGHFAFFFGFLNGGTPQSAGLCWA